MCLRGVNSDAKEKRDERCQAASAIDFGPDRNHFLLLFNGNSDSTQRKPASLEITGIAIQSKSLWFGVINIQNRSARS
jgi:hypothetical protein